jgi:hypothetical protein
MYCANQSPRGLSTYLIKLEGLLKESSDFLQDAPFKAQP